MPKKYVEARREIEISLPESLVAALDILFFDPARGKPAHGKRSEFIAIAIRDRLLTLKKAEKSL